MSAAADTRLWVMMRECILCDVLEWQPDPQTALERANATKREEASAAAGE